MRVVVIGVLLGVLGCPGRVAEGEDDVVGEGEGDVGEGEGDDDSWALFFVGDVNGGLVAARATSSVSLVGLRAEGAALVDGIGEERARFSDAGFAVTVSDLRGQIVWQQVAATERLTNVASLVVDRLDRVWLAVLVQAGSGDSIAFADQTLQLSSGEGLVVARLSAIGELEWLESHTGAAGSFAVWPDGRSAELRTPTTAADQPREEASLTWRDSDGVVSHTLALPSVHNATPHGLQVAVVDERSDDVFINVLGPCLPSRLPLLSAASTVNSADNLVARVAPAGVVWARAEEPIPDAPGTGGRSFTGSALTSIDGVVHLAGIRDRNRLIDVVTRAVLIDAVGDTASGFLVRVDADGNLNDVLRLGEHFPTAAARVDGETWLQMGERASNSVANFGMVVDQALELGPSIAHPDDARLFPEGFDARGDVVVAAISASPGTDMKSVVPSTSFIAATNSFVVFRPRLR